MMKQLLHAVGFLLLIVIPATNASIKPEVSPAVLPSPSVEHSPEDVVRIVIQALANNNTPFDNAGIVITFSFASPANKSQTGPIDRFIRMVKADPYGDMVNHSQSRFSEVAIEGNNAYQYVQLTTDNGSQVVYGFRLSKQTDGEFVGMWMTDAVWPVSKASSY